MSNICFRLNCCAMINNSDDHTPTNSSKNIPKEQKKKKKATVSTPKILLLGTGESGKSTFLKQMRFIAGKTFTEEELVQFKDIIYENIYKGVLFLLHARSTIKIPWAGGEGCSAEQAEAQLEEHFCETRAQRPQRAFLGDRTLLWTEKEFLALAPLFRAIWTDSSIKMAFDQRNRLITEEFNYVPSEEDIVWSRRPTDAIVVEEILVNRTPLTFIDVGGQTRERRKWCQTFSDMTSVLFLVASSHYDELYLDRVTGEFRNKLREAMAVFECLINLDSFRRVSIILFFNKTDLLREKMAARVSGIRAHFEEFPEGADEFSLVAVQNFLVETFSSRVDPIVCPLGYETSSPSPSNHQNRYSGFQQMRMNSMVGRSASLNAPSSSNLLGGDRVLRRRTIYRHFTTAVNRKNIETVFNAMQDTILQKNLRRLMMC